MKSDCDLLGSAVRLARRVWRPAEHSLQACAAVPFGETPDGATETVALPQEKQIPAVA